MIPMEVDPMAAWCESVRTEGSDLTSDDLKEVLKGSESRAYHQAKDLLGESTQPPPFPPNLPTIPPRERVHFEQIQTPNYAPMDDCRVSEEPGYCVSQGMFPITTC